MDTKEGPYICCLQETHFSPRDTCRLKVRGWKKIYHANGNQKKAGLAILISEIIDLKIKTIIIDKEQHYKMIKGTVQEKDKTILNIYVPNILEGEVKWASESITMSKASGCDGIPVELFQFLKDDAVKVLHSVCQQIWKTQQWPQDWKTSVFIPTPKKGNPKECLNYCTIALISHASKPMLKILHARLQ